MQNALQNHHYKKIWEEVNWKSRNPQAKSLEEALKFERKEPLSLLVAYSWPREQTFTSVEYDTRNWDNGMARVERVLGRPITLEDILSLLNHQPWENRGWIQSFRITETVNKGEYHINIYDKDYAGVGLCFWQLTKPLHEQTPETWEKIANLI